MFEFSRHGAVRFGLCLLLVLTLLATLAGCEDGAVSVTVSPARSTAEGRVVFLAGPDSHGPWAHEHDDGSRLLAAELQRRWPNIETIQATGGWPDDDSLFEDIDAMVIYCDGGEGHLINAHLPTFNQLVRQGVGVAALHYAVEVPKGSPSADAMLSAIGGYFETDWSVNPHWEATFSPLPDHPVAQGVQPFTMDDEWYFNMRFQPEGQGVLPLLVAVPPADTMSRPNGPHSGNDAVREMVAERQPQTVAWLYQREDGGRGFGFTGGHYHSNWQDENALRLVVNAIAWVSGADFPED